MSFVNEFIQSTQQEVVKEVTELVEAKGIKEKVLKEAQAIAQQTANHILDPKAEAPQQYKGITVGSSPEDPERQEYLLVLDYLESVGFKFAPSVLRYESQHPDIMSNRAELAKNLGLRSYDRTPLLVQLIEERLNHTAHEGEE